MTIFNDVPIYAVYNISIVPLFFLNCFPLRYRSLIHNNQRTYHRTLTTIERIFSYMYNAT